MRQSLLISLFLAIVAISSSNIILEPMNTVPNLRGQENDNTYFNNKDSVEKYICDDINTPIIEQEISTLCKVLKLKSYINRDNNKIRRNILDDIVQKREGNYDGKGFRKVQWHNYPRQLDRLQRFLFKRHKPVEDGNEKNPEVINNDMMNDILSYNDKDLSGVRTDEVIILNSNKGEQIYDAVVASTDPLLILKLRLACLSNGLINDNTKEYVNSANTHLNIDDIKENFIRDAGEQDPNDVVQRASSDLEPSQEIINYFGVPNNGDEIADEWKSIPEKKRIFSMWSRLQSLNPKGHELHHRRHMHAYYVQSAADTNSGIVNAVVPRTPSRPPGSPLRWG